MAKVKAANYSVEDIATLTAGYVAGEDNKSQVSVLAAKLGKTTNSVRAKLANLGLYQAEKKAASTSTRVKKADIVAGIAAKVEGLNEADCDGLEKATSGALTKVLASLTNKAAATDSE